MQVTPAAIHKNHYGAPYKPVTLIRDESPLQRPEAGFQIECGDRDCTEHYEISGPPSYPSQAIQKKFQQQGWFVHTSDYRKNRCPKHAHGARADERPASSALDRARANAETLFGPKKAEPVAAAPPAPAIDYTPKPRHEPPPQARAARTELRQPKMAAKVLEVTGVPEDLNKFSRLIDEQLKWAEKSVRDLKVMKVTLRDAMKHAGLQMGGQ